MTRFENMVAGLRSNRRGGSAIEHMLLAGLLAGTAAIGYGTFGTVAGIPMASNGVCISAEFCTLGDGGTDTLGNVIANSGKRGL
jgi:Flp pilus assembly pilin Flp